MNVKRKSLFVILFIITLILTVLMLCVIKKMNHKTSDLPISRIHGTFVYDTAAKNECVGISDYVFVGKVISNDGTIYKNTKGSPYTNYTIQVITNIKGQLITENPISITKKGGINQDETYIYLFEDDCLPQVDEEYVFLACTQEDGSLLIAGPNSNLNVEDESVIASYQEAKNNEVIKYERKRFVSIYDKNFK